MIIPLPKSSKAPFSYAGTRGNILLLHGFTGTPYEMKPLGLFLNQHGFGVSAPLLPGHGGHSGDLAKVGAHDWLNDSFSAFEKLPTDKPRIVIGLSMGGLLATMIAARLQDQVSGLVLLAPAYYIHPIGHLAIWLTKVGLARILPRVAKKGAGGDVSDKEAQEKNPSGKDISIKALLQFDRLRQEAIALAPQVKCKTFAAFGDLDRTVHSKKSARILARFQVPLLEVHHLPKSRHLLPIDVERVELCQWILRFCESCV